MINAELLAKIKAEIERLKKVQEVSEDKDYAQYELDVACGYDMACDDLLSFLSTLESEKSQVDLDEETICIEFHTIADKCFNEGIEGWQREKLIARHFAQWGAEHRGSSEISNDLQSACNYANFEESHSLNAYIAFEEGFKKGAKWQAEQ